MNEPLRPETSTVLRTLLRYRFIATRRRMTTGSVWLRVAVFGLLVAAAAGITLGMWEVARGDAAAAMAGVGIDAGGPVPDRVFWLLVGMVFIFAYTTFEAFFRARDQDFVNTLPIRGQDRYGDLALRAILIHLPLALPAAAYAIALTAHGAGAWGTYTATLTGFALVAGLPLCIWLHLLAGRSMVAGASAVKQLLASGLVPDEGALLVYAPAAGLLATLTLSIVAEMMLRAGFSAVVGAGGGTTDDVTIGVLGVMGGAVVIATLSVMRSRQLCDAHLHEILPRFNEFDTTPPFTDDGHRRVVPGEALARWLPAPWRPYYLRDTRQLRRRHRIDRLVLVAWAAAALVINLNAPKGSVLATNLLLLFVLSGLLWTSAFRLAGGELASPWLEASLPIDPRGHWWGRIAADLYYPVSATLVGGVAVAAGGRFAEAALFVGIGLVGVLLMTMASQAIAGRFEPKRVFGAALAWRAVIAAAAGLLMDVVFGTPRGGI